MKILYGIIDNNIDVTNICYEKLRKQNIITIPCGDCSRAAFFTDPLINVLKSIFITNISDGIIEYDSTKDIYIDISANTIFTNDNVPSYISSVIPNIQEKLKGMHSNLRIDYGSFNEEYPEQMMATRYLTGHEKVLEIGGNIGRNTLVISYILSQQRNYNFVTLESDVNIASQLEHNKSLNGLNFNIESSALSKRMLIQEGWNTIASDILLDGYTAVKTITLTELHAKYNIIFDTLVLDCEGAFYYILMDMPEILDNVNLIIMENDYLDILHKNYIDDILRKNSFYVDYVEAGGWGCCYNNFFEVWKRRN
jgi:FkbM family methyltransferase